jgi:hypothetical protein
MAENTNKAETGGKPEPLKLVEVAKGDKRMALSSLKSKLPPHY